MAGKGKKHTCAECKHSFYDLGKADPACPKCKTKASEKSKRRPVGKKKAKSEKPDDVSIVMDLFEVNDANTSKGYSLSNGIVDLQYTDIRPGWYAVAASSIKDKAISIDAPLLYLNTPPLGGLQTYLSSIRFRGIGNITASDLIERNGFVIPRALSGSIEFIEAELKVKTDVAKSLFLGWQSSPKENIFTIVMHELGLLEMQIREVCKSLGADIITLLNTSPFALVKSLPRLNFHDIDRICARSNIEITQEQRVIVATDFYLGDAENRLRHTCLPEDNLHQRVSELLTIPVEEIARILSSHKNEFVYSDRKDRVVVANHASALRDQKIAKEIASIKKAHKPIDNGAVFDARNIETSEDITLSDEQIEAINAVVKAAVSVITGGPGSGKTTMVQGLISALKSLKADARLCAPTGRAAKRISETPGLAELKPSTIHMFLAKERSAKSASDFDVMIVDEASMIDADLMVDLLEAIPEGTSIIFIGDVDQLPPVGPGQPFKDLIESETVPVSRLTGNFRQASFSDTVKAARDVIRGKTPKISSALASTDFTFMECPQAEQADTILRLYFDLLPAKLKVKPQDIQIISPQRPGEVGVLRLNDLIQQRLTGGTKPIFKKKSGTHEVTFFIGDKVIQRKNNYELGVMNGDQGVITRESGQDLMVEFDSQEIAFDGLQRFELDLAYATTIHSSQGSEYPGVIIPVVAAHAHMLSRNLIYTAITRGKQQVCIVGELAALEKALAQYQKDFRWTSLTEQLKVEL